MCVPLKRDWLEKGIVDLPNPMRIILPLEEIQSMYIIRNTSIEYNSISLFIKNLLEWRGKPISGKPLPQNYATNIQLNMD